MRPTRHLQSLRLLALVTALMLVGSSAAPGAEMSDAVYQAKKRVTDADGQVRKATTAFTMEANRFAKVVESTPEWKQASTQLKDAQARFNKASYAVKASLTTNENYKKALAERTRLQEEKEALRVDPQATPEQRMNAAVATLKAAGEVGKIEQQAIEDDVDVAKAKSAMNQAQYMLDELRRGAMAQAAKDPGVIAARDKVNAAKVQLADAEKQFQEAKKQQARADEQKLNAEIEKNTNSILNANNNNRR